MLYHCRRQYPSPVVRLREGKDKEGNAPPMGSVIGRGTSKKAMISKGPVPLCSKVGRIPLREIAI
jgi:hypothetical protein